MKNKLHDRVQDCRQCNMQGDDIYGADVSWITTGRQEQGQVNKEVVHRQQCVQIFVAGGEDGGG